MGVNPTALMQQPWLDGHGTPLGRPFGQDARRLLAASFVDPADLLPEAEQTLKLPAQASSDQHLAHREHAARDSGQ